MTDPDRFTEREQRQWDALFAAAFMHLQSLSSTHELGFHASKTADLGIESLRKLRNEKSGTIGDKLQ